MICKISEENKYLWLIQITQIKTTKNKFNNNIQAILWFLTIIYLQLDILAYNKLMRKMKIDR